MASEVLVRAQPMSQLSASPRGSWFRSAPERGADGGPVSDPAPNTREEEGRVLCCGACALPIASERDVICVGSASPVQTFANPAGFVWEILTLRQAPGALVHGRPTSDFTWFAGTTWRLAACSSCGRHLGWHYEGEREPRAFYGFIRDRLA